MAAKPLTSEKIALTEKKMDMALDDIIKLSKTTTKVKKQRVPNKSQKFLNLNNTNAQDKSLKMRHFMDSRSSLRQGVLAQRRSSFQGNQFPLAAEVARKAAVAPIHNRGLNRNRVVNWNKPRALAPPVQRKTANGGYAVKHQPPKQPQQKQKQQQELNTVPKQRPQTLDSLFANMKEQRMRVLSQQNNSVQHSGGGQQRQQRGRGRFRN